MTQLRSKFAVGDIVYSVVGEHKGIVTGIQWRSNGLCYLVTWGHDLTERFHYEFELSIDCKFDCGAQQEIITQ